MTRLKREEEKRSNGATCVARAREGWKRKATKLEGRTVLDQPRDIARLPLYNVARYISGYAHVFVHPRKILYIPLTWKTWIGLASNQATNCHSWQFIIFKIMKNWKSDDFCTIFQLRTAAKLEEIRRFSFFFFYKVSSTFVFPVASFVEIIRVRTFMEIYATSFFFPEARRNIYLYSKSLLQIRVARRWTSNFEFT